MTARSANPDLDAPLDPLSEAALAWLVRLHDGTATDADWDAYEAWQSSSPEHQRAAQATEILWQSIGPAIQRPRRHKAGRLLAALLVVGFGLWLTTLTGAPHHWLADLRTGAGELQSVTLADGSQLLLDAGSSVDVDIADDHRRLTLHRGALQVQVSPDAARPFEVRAAGGTIRALGTAFEVRRLDHGNTVRVAVTEHAVSVQYQDGLRRVDSGETLQYGPDLLGQPQPADLRSLTAWQRGRLVFDNRPLGQVVDEMQRYRSGLILIADERLRSLPITGVFETGDAEALVDAVAAVLPVQVTRLPWLAIIRPR